MDEDIGDLQDYFDQSLDQDWELNGKKEFRANDSSSDSEVRGRSRVRDSSEGDNDSEDELEDEEEEEVEEEEEGEEYLGEDKDEGEKEVGDEEEIGYETAKDDLGFRNNHIDWSIIQHEFKEFQSDLATVTGVGTKNGKKARRIRGGQKGRRAQSPSTRLRRNQTIPPDLLKPLGDMNLLYIQRRFDECIKLIHEIIQRDPEIFDAWFTLGMIFEELGDNKKSVQVLLVAAHISKYDHGLWLKLARFSKEDKQFDLALYCYGKALQAHKKDYQTMKDRGELAQIHGKYKLALLCFKQQLRLYPHSMEIINRLVLFCRDTNQLSECQESMYSAMKYHLTYPTIPLEFGYNELNIAVELLISTNKYIDGLNFIIRGYQLLNEFMEDWDDNITLFGLVDKTNGLNKVDGFKLPLEIKVKIGLLLTLLNFDDNGQLFFQCLFDEDIVDYHDLYIDTAKTYITKQRYPEALNLLLKLMDDYPQAINYDAMLSIAICFHKLKDYSLAIEHYLKADELDNSQLEPKQALAHLYELIDENQKSIFYVGKVVNLSGKKTRIVRRKLGMKPESKRLKKIKRIKDNRDQFIDETILTKRRSSRKSNLNKNVSFDSVDEEEKELLLNMESDGSEYKDEDNLITATSESEYFEEEENNHSKETVMKPGIFSRFDQKTILPLNKNPNKMDDEVRHRLVANNFILIRKLVKKLEGISLEQCLDSNEISNGFINMLYPLYKEFILTRKEMPKPKKARYDQDMEELINTSGFNEKEMELTICQVELWRWVDLFVKATFVMKHMNRIDTAALMLTNVQNAHFFRLNLRLRLYFLMLKFGLYYQNGDYNQLFDSIRQLTGSLNDLYPGDIFTLIHSVMTPGPDLYDVMPNQITVKFFARIVSNIEKKPCKTLKERHRLAQSYFFLAHLHLNAKSNGQAAQILFKSKPLIQDRLIDLSLAICFINLSVQRNTPNRHAQLLHGFTYLLQYFHQAQSQEGHYNLARAFQFYGLDSMAIHHYKKVLDLSDQAIKDQQPINPNNDLKFEAAHNLCLIYICSGSHALADWVRMKYCTI